MATNSPQQAPHDPSPTDLPAEDGALAEQIDERWLALIDAALKVQAPLARSPPGRTCGAW